MSWIIVLVTLVIIGFLLDREVYFYEGVHLGPRVQSWLYDRWAKNYDAGKQSSQLHDDEMLAAPLLDALSAVPKPFVLDFATGTGRLSHALLSRSDFHGHIIALDLSQGMLEQAAKKLGRAPRYATPEPMFTTSREDTVPPSGARVELLRHHSLPLPFLDAAFDVVCALEVLELFPNMDEPLHEFGRVLRPGGILLASRGTEQSGRKAKIKSKQEFRSLLEDHGFNEILITGWWKLFDRVIAVKRGDSSPVAWRALSDVLRCGGCNLSQWQQGVSTLKCQNCSRELPITREGIVLN